MKATLYQIRNDRFEFDSYVGSTIDLIKRNDQHRLACHDLNNHTPVYEFIRANGGWGEWYIVKLFDVWVKNKKELLKIERQCIEDYGGTLNTVIPYRTKEETREMKRVKRQEQRDARKADYQAWYEENKTGKPKVYACDQCDKTFTTKQNMLMHMRTKKYKRGCVAMTYECKECMEKFREQFKIDYPDTYEKELKERFTFEYKGRLDTHKKSKMHNDIPRKPRAKKPFDPTENCCEVCDKQFEIRESYLQHMRDHRCPFYGYRKIAAIKNQILVINKCLPRRCGEDESAHSQRHTDQTHQLRVLEDLLDRHKEYFKKNQIKFDTPQERCKYIERLVEKEARKQVLKKVDASRKRRQKNKKRPKEKEEKKVLVKKHD